ncbi:AEC family transporter [Phytohalomonas tamaricis]|uniref:AEC family transporter n=1 Tax=Phytohalomonas tamaricis TaxID=2081032 RepID=UPI000D0B4CAC|nr:AEC family transporter [Phytohalomonas tamaricis]
MFAQLFAVMAPVLAGAGVGFFWVKFKQPYPTEFITKLVLNVGTPCLIIGSLSQTHIDIEAFKDMTLATLLVVAIMALIGAALAYWRKLEWQTVVPAMAFPNTGNMGLPISLYAFGQQGFGYAVAVFVVMSLLQFVVGSLTASKRPLRSIVRTPTIYAIVIALIMMAYGITLPQWLANSVELLAGFTIPMMLITLGVSLASIRARNIGVGVSFGLMRVAIAAVISLAIGWALSLPEQEMAQLMLQMCMPVAVYNYLFALKAGRSPEKVASLVLCSTLLSFLYLPILLSWVLSLD